MLMAVFYMITMGPLHIFRVGVGITQEHVCNVIVLYSHWCRAHSVVCELGRGGQPCETGHASTTLYGYGYGHTYITVGRVETLHNHLIETLGKEIFVSY